MIGALTTLAELTSVFPDRGTALAGIAIGVGLIVAGAAKGIGHIAGNAVESIARQPEAGGRIGTNMIIAAALIEGFTFFALIVAILVNGKVS
ncbi:MAG: ATP synthase F0 subunit C [Planctomycetes bacterium]|nr:ATP synthase F0 subunit C [Planctomycetota bacterium]